MTEQFQTGHLRHSLVGNDDGKFALFYLLQRQQRTGQADNFIAGIFQRVPQQGKRDGLIIHEENRVLRLVGCVQIIHVIGDAKI